MIRWGAQNVTVYDGVVIWEQDLPVKEGSTPGGAGTGSNFTAWTIYGAKGIIIWDAAAAPVDPGPNPPTGDPSGTGGTGLLLGV